MGPGWQPWTGLERRSNHIPVKLSALVLLVYLTFRILFSGFVVLLPVPELPAVAVDRSDSREVAVGVVSDAKPRKGVMRGSGVRQRTYHPNAIIFSAHVVEYLLLTQGSSSTDSDYPVPEAAPQIAFVADNDILTGGNRSCNIRLLLWLSIV
ncbi:hypothetical protein MUK42_32769 [Musa troglodytarum]|uniref:Uncharacterized protein n=1 Tax=Musa troglodytarum TaxID=320322 RepID=A0A9E7L8I9_9LILI|nr:hypothetical protein MUK42_32769 [Musa troglodytarum]